MRKNTAILLAITISAAFLLVAPVVPPGWPSGTFEGRFHYNCPPGDSKIQGLPVLYTMSVSYALFKVGFIYDQQLNPPLAFETSSTINLPCNR
jgi:hypothetical protein